MPSERVQRQIEALLDQAEAAASTRDWQAVIETASAVLGFDQANEDANAFVNMARAALAEISGNTQPPSAGLPAESSEANTPAPSPSEPESFAGGRYQVLRFLGEGGKKRVFLAHDTLLDRDVAFSLIKTEGLDEVGRQRIMREAQAMGRLTHQNIVSIYDIGEHVSADGTKQQYLVQELMGGGDVEILLENAEDGLPLERSLAIAIETARGLEFAHAQGVVHRDLKPGNVWLTSDGVAKIGDLGLAVTLGQSRLTTHGVMVGTYSYMPPEQALGQEVTAKADLYSLGAMLYELVTGQPPFRGDTPTAVISQHLNTQPVAPSWHTEHCPPDLEALILRLLAKVPADRPTSATEVITALAAVDPEGRSTSHSDSLANPLDRLARGVFVGRECELEQLRESLDATLQGRGSVVMLVGEPGIGKTRTVQELETYARMRGASVYWGRSREAQGSPPYHPWIQVGNAYGQQNDLTALALGPNANELVRLFPQLPEIVPGIQQPSEIVDATSARFQLFDAYASFLRAATAEQPAVVVLDDLHWADKPTLLLLTHLATELSNMPLLVIGTYRDTDLVRTHPLSETLAGLSRAGGFTRVVLKGLDQDEVAGYVRQRASVDPSPVLLDRIYEETEGNPFFLSEIVNLMAQEGTLARADTSSISDIALPDGVRETLGRRLDRLSEEANELLAMASLIGREFAYDTLTLLVDRDADTLLQLIEESLDAHVIEESARPGRYRFTHALMQETLLDELSTTRRLRLHGEIAQAFEHRWSDPSDEQALVLARHFTEAAALNKDHVPQAVHYSRLAALAAEAQSAWDEAARHYDAVLNLREDTPDLDIDEAPLLTSLGVALRNSGQQRRAWGVFMRAIDLYRQSADWVGFATAAEKTARIFAPPHRLAALVSEAMAGIEGTDPHLEAVLLSQLVNVSIGVMKSRDVRLPTDIEQQVARSLSSARNTGDREAQALLSAAAAYLRSERGEANRSDWHEAYELLDGVGRNADSAQALLASSVAVALLSEIRAARSIAEQAVAYAERNGLVEHRGTGRAHLAIYAIMCGELAEIDRNETELKTSPSYIARSALAMRHAIAAEFDEAIAALPPTAMAAGIPVFAAQIQADRTRVFWLAGRRAAADEEFRLWRQAIDAVGVFDDPKWFGFSGPGLLAEEFLTELGDQELVQNVYAVLGRSTIATQYSPRAAGGVHAVRGDLALWLEKIDEAESHYSRELEVAERERLPFARGTAHQGLAEVAERRGDLEAASRHLDAAAELFSQYGAKLYLDQVIAKKEILKA